VPGLSPRLPSIEDGPVFVTVDPASTANDAAVPNCTVGCAADAIADTPTTEAKRRQSAEMTEIASVRFE
jgi:hypothetical protein